MKEVEGYLEETGTNTEKNGTEEEGQDYEVGQQNSEQLIAKTSIKVLPLGCHWNKTKVVETDNFKILSTGLSKTAGRSEKGKEVETC